jgi:hypothetical protein
MEPIPVDPDRLARACELLRDHIHAAAREKFLAVLRKLAGYGWLNESSVADACLLAPLAWLEEARLVYEARMRAVAGHHRIYVLGPDGEAWHDVAPQVQQALAVFGGAEPVQLRHARAWLALRWKEEKKARQGSLL